MTRETRIDNHNKDVTNKHPEQDFWSSVKGKEYIEIDGKKYVQDGRT